MEHARLKTSQTVGRGNWMQPVQLDRCTLHILDDSSVVRADRKGRVVEPAELGDRPGYTSDPADACGTPVCLALVTVGRKRLNNNNSGCTPHPLAHSCSFESYREWAETSIRTTRVSSLAGMATVQDKAHGLMTA